MASADNTTPKLHERVVPGSQSQQVGDVNGHTLNLFRLLGLAFFPDGSTGTTLVIGTSDAVSGVGGTGNGYYTLNFGDGSELWFRYTGAFKLDNSKVPQGGTAIVIGGKGRYAGAKGEGTWEGAATQPGPEGISYIDNVFNIKK